MDALYSEFESFPSAQGDQYRSIKAEVATQTETVMGKTWIEVDSEFRLADGRSIASISLLATGPVDDVAEEIQGVRADLEFAKRTFDRWYEATLEGLDEADALVAAAA